MKTNTKTKLIKSDDKTSIDKYRLAANITEYHIISKFWFLTYLIVFKLEYRDLSKIIILKNHDDKAIISCKICMSKKKFKMDVHSFCSEW